MSTFDLVEKKIGRRLLSCNPNQPGVDTIPIRDEGVTRHFWVPSFELYKEIVLDIADYYRAYQPVARTNEVWPYIEPYYAISWKLYKNYALNLYDVHQKFNISNKEGRTVYDYINSAIPFSDGATVLDPFCNLVSTAFISCLNSKEFGIDSLVGANAMLKDAEYPYFGRDALSRFFSPLPDALDDDFGIPKFQLDWISSLNQAIRLKPYLSGGYVRLVPGATNATVFFQRHLADETTAKSFGSMVNRLVTASNISATDTKALYNIYATAERLVQTNAYPGATPFFFDPKQLFNSIDLIKNESSRLIQPYQKAIPSAVLNSVVGLNIKGLDDTTIIDLRKSAEFFGRWRELRSELNDEIVRLSLADRLDERRVLEIADYTSRKWSERITLERQSDGLVSRKLMTSGLIYGVLGAAVTGGAAAAFGAEAAAIMGTAAGGGGASVLAPMQEALRRVFPGATQSDARAAYEKHVLALAKRPGT